MGSKGDIPQRGGYARTDGEDKRLVVICVSIVKTETNICQELPLRQALN